MKVIELRTEKVRLEMELQKGIYFVPNSEPYFNRRTREVKKEMIEDIKKKYADDQQMLKKLDAVNNALNESDATTYVEVEGCRLSMATARQYYEQLTDDECKSRFDRLPDDDDETLDDLFHHTICSDFIASENMRAVILNRCCIDQFLEEELDPLKLRDRRHEFRAKVTDWCFGLGLAIAKSDATTEVNFVF